MGPERPAFEFYRSCHAHNHNDNQQPTTNHQPPTTNKQQPTNNKQQTTNHFWHLPSVTFVSSWMYDNKAKFVSTP